MRKLFASCMLLLATSGLALADINSFLRPVNARDITFTPIDTTHPIASPSLPSTPGRFTITNFLSKFSLSTMFSRPVIGQSPLPSPGSFPSTHYTSPIQPQMPVMGGH
ncbi:MAG TPA: hypothetical protein VGY58_07465 [Gemmataceae bacterium]|nr:hypothetical protein [Gemmataceae bacterium]